MNERHRLWLQSGKVQSVLLDQLLASTPALSVWSWPSHGNENFTHGETVER